MVANFSVKHKWHDFPLLEYEFAWCRMDQESVDVLQAQDHLPPSREL